MSRETMFLLGIGAVIVAWKLTGKKAAAKPAPYTGPDYGPSLAQLSGPDYGPPNVGPDYGPPNVMGFGTYVQSELPAGWQDPFTSPVA
jgi:hypothetical protein